LKFGCVDAHDRLRDGSAANKGVAVNHGDCTSVVRVHVVDVRDVVHRVIVIDIDDCRSIDDSRIREVDRFDVTWAHLIGRDVNVARTERKPAYADATAEFDADPKATATNESDQRWSIDGSDGNGTGDPAPRVANHGPTSIVERRESPWFGVNPGPAPRCNPAPAAVVIGLPIGTDIIGNPVFAICGIVAPGSITVHVFVTRYIG